MYLNSAVWIVLFQCKLPPAIKMPNAHSLHAVHYCQSNWLVEELMSRGKGKAFNPSSSRNSLQSWFSPPGKTRCKESTHCPHPRSANSLRVCCVPETCIEPCFHHYHTRQQFKFDDPSKTRDMSGRKRAKTQTEWATFIVIHCFLFSMATIWEVS